MAFNVLAHNRDDHLKNHAFLMDASGSWRLSSAHDHSFSDGPGGEHHLAIAGEGRRPGLIHVEAVGGRALGMKPSAIATLVDPVRAAIADWPRHTEDAGVPSRRAKQIADYFTTQARRNRASQGKALCRSLIDESNLPEFTGK